MSENAINNRRRWKAEVFPYDDFMPDDSNECQYCLTEKQAEILRGIVEPLGWNTRWWSTTTEIDTDKIQAFKDDIIRRLMMSCCGDGNPILYRYTVDGVLQQSTDDGVTWTDAPLKDPRNNSTVFPPITGSDGDDKACLAATGMVAIMKSQVGDNLTDDMSHYTLGQLITDWVHTMIQSSNPFEALLTIAVNQIFALVISVLRAAITDAVYDTLKCIFYCHMSPDASFTQIKVDSVRGDITAQIGGVAGVFFEHLVYLLGTVGMTNLARASGATTGDCSSCGCGCPTIYTWTNSNVVLSLDTDCVAHDLTPTLTDGTYYMYLGAQTSPPSFPTTDGFSYGVHTLVSGTVETNGYYRLDGTVGYDFGVIPSKVAAVFFESHVPFVLDIQFLPA